jgi:beta-galactosidase
MKKLLQIFLLLSVMGSQVFAQSQNQAAQSAAASSGRERLQMDFGWRFAFGHAYDTDKDFSHATAYFSYFTKAGYGDGPASANFDDRAWRILNLPHDWAVEVPFASNGSYSHGFKAVGRDFPENSIGWYRKSFSIPSSDLGWRISVEFDGVFRDSIVWINGHYLGHEPSGYSGFRYDITDYLDYGGNNVIAVRVDATMEEGWFYEGAGIYRHVWLVKTAPLHVASYGTFVSSDVRGNTASVTSRATVINEGATKATFNIIQNIVDAEGKSIATGQVKKLSLEPCGGNEFSCVIKVKKPNLWSLELPYLYKLITTIRIADAVVDNYETTFGIRTIRFDPNEGFFLNGKHVELKGTNVHQDHAGVGAAVPDALQEFRIARLKEMGSNAYRCSHNPPTTELLDACDRLGMLVIDENRLMGTTPELLDQLERLILRDRNHPSVIIWSLGNEEWAIEGNITGERIAATMQAFAKRLDPTRRTTVAISGGWGEGISKVIDVMGYNYIMHGSTDEHHAKFPNQPGIGTEESITRGTRGIYFDDKPNAHMAPLIQGPTGGNIETGWKHYAARPYLAGLFYWTGFDHRGEAHPFGWPQVSSQCGILDICGFPKDCFYYLKSWWTDETVLYVYPHWNWKGKEGQEFDVWAYSNCDEVELFLNNESLGRKNMEKDSHLEWKVKYQPGTLLARGYKNGKEVAAESIETAGELAAIQLTAYRAIIKADGEDISVITVQVNDSNGRCVPTAKNEIIFAIEGPGKIIGVGNGDPSSHEPDRYIESVSQVRIENLKMQTVDGTENRPEVAFDFNDSSWQEFKQPSEYNKEAKGPAKVIVIRGEFDLQEFADETKITLLTKSLCEEQTIYVNGHRIAQNIKCDAPGQEYILDHTILRPDKNVYAIIGNQLAKKNQWEDLNTDPGIIQVITPAPTWKRSVFNGLAQVIVQSTQQPGKINLTVTSQDLSKAVLSLETQAATLRPAIPER